MLQEGIKRCWQILLDIIFPIKCLSCRREGEWICQECVLKIKLNDGFACPGCRRQSRNGSFCVSCLGQSELSGIVVAASYEDDLLQKAIQAMKYQFVQDLSIALVDKLGVAFCRWLEVRSGKINQKDVVLVPVPLHKKRRRQRGFNQAEILASRLADMMSVSYCQEGLLRIKHRPAQARLDSRQRIENIKGVFAVADSQYFQGKVVILVDDVCTTSATLSECAQEINKAEPREIWGLVLARGK